MLYPEIYYKVEPYILSACDEMTSFGSDMPSKKAISAMSDRVYAQIMEAYPELIIYEVQSAGAGSGKGAADKNTAGDKVTAARRGGLLGDFLDVLLIYELIGRRRR